MRIDLIVCLVSNDGTNYKYNTQAFLPGLDDNFLADHIVTFPIVSARHDASADRHSCQ